MSNSLDKSTITSTIVSNGEHDEKSSAAKIYNFLSKSQKFKNSVCSLFLFKPPKPKGYKFEKTSFVNGEIKYKFFLHTDRGIYRPPSMPENMELTTYCLKIKSKTQVSSKETIPAIYLKNNDCEDRFLVIYSHGNASDLGDVFEFARSIATLYKINVLAYDYRGYGISGQHQTSEKSTYEDLEFVMSFAQEKLKYELSNIILWGFSLGTGPTVELAARFQNLGGVILQSPLASVMIWLDSKAGWDYGYSIGDMYCSINKIESIKSKIFIIHGKRDQTIDVRHSNLLYEKYVNSSRDNNQIWLVLAEEVGHNDIQFLIEDEGGIFYKRIVKFIELVKYPQLLRENSLLHPRGRSIKEENKFGFLEKEKKTLQISFKMLEVNEYKNPEQSPAIPIPRKKFFYSHSSVLQNENESECSKNDDTDSLLMESDLNVYKQKTKSVTMMERKRITDKSLPKRLTTLKEENEDNEGKKQEGEYIFKSGYEDLNSLVQKNYF